MFGVGRHRQNQDGTVRSPIQFSKNFVSSKGMQTRVSSSTPLARRDTTDFLVLRRPRAPAPSDMTPAATAAAAAAPGALTFGVALGALEEALEALAVTRLAEELGAWHLAVERLR